MINRITRLIIVLVIVIFNVVPVYADTSVTITVTAVPLVTNSISDFYITYVNDTRLDITWTLGSGLSNIMVRAKYGAYPADITDGLTAPSDGYLVYYGNGNSVSDTSMNFDQNPGLLYYKAWGQNIDGSWQITTSTGSKESKELILLSFIALVGILLAINIATRNSFIPIKLMAAFAWALPLIWVIGYPPNFIVAGSNIQTGFILIIIGMMLICGFNAFRQPLQVSNTANQKFGVSSISTERGGWHLPDFLRDKNSYEYKAMERQNRLSEYRSRAHGAAFGGRKRDRNGRYVD